VFQGNAVCISVNGAVVVVGGPKDFTLGGAVWIFTINATGMYTQQGGKLMASSATSYFGNSLALSLDTLTLAIGANTDNINVGAVFVFLLSAGSYQQQGPLFCSSSRHIRIHILIFMNAFI
jgi:FG-GAP repeat